MAGERGQDQLTFQLGERLADTGVDAGTEGEVRMALARHVEAIGIRVAIRIAIGGGDQQQHLGIGRNGDAVDRDRLGRGAPDMRRRRAMAQPLVEGRRQQRRVGAYRLPLRRIGRQRLDGEADGVGRGVHARREEGADEDRGIRARHAGGGAFGIDAIAQPARRQAFAAAQLRDAFGAALRAGLGGSAHRIVGPHRVEVEIGIADHHVPILVRQAEHRRYDDQREGLGQLVLGIEPPFRDEAAHHVVGHRREPLAYLA